MSGAPATDQRSNRDNGRSTIERHRLLRAIQDRLELPMLVAALIWIALFIVDAVRGLHGNPYSWTDIGRALGITRQAAQMRFAKATR